MVHGVLGSLCVSTMQDPRIPVFQSSRAKNYNTVVYACRPRDVCALLFVVRPFRWRHTGELCHPLRFAVTLSREAKDGTALCATNAVDGLQLGVTEMSV